MHLLDSKHVIGMLLKFFPFTGGRIGVHIDSVVMSMNHYKFDYGNGTIFINLTPITICAFFLSHIHLSLESE